MDKKWWEHEQRLCESHGLHILANKAHEIAEGTVIRKSPEQRAREYLAQVEQQVILNFARIGTKRLVYSVKVK